jgi:hypothetical protein
MEKTPEDHLADIIEMKPREDGIHAPSVPTRPSAARNTLSDALRANGVNRRGLIRQLVDIAHRGEKVTTIEKKGKIVERRVTQDPSIQMKAIDQLSGLLDRSEGVVEHASMSVTRYNAN